MRQALQKPASLSKKLDESLIDEKYPRLEVRSDPQNMSAGRQHR
jgi:hypothetical protein